MTQSKTSLEIVADFWAGFAREPFYDTGFADAVAGSGAATATDENSMIEALCFLNGYAQCARLTCPFDGPHWRIANMLANVAELLTFRFGDDRDGEKAFEPDRAARLIESFRAELTELVREKEHAV